MKEYCLKTGRLLKLNRIWSIIFCIYFLTIFVSCDSSQKPTISKHAGLTLDSVAKHHLLSSIINSTQDNNRIRDSLFVEYEKSANFNKNIYYWALKALNLPFGFKDDSLISSVNNIYILPKQVDEWALKKYVLLKSKADHTDINSSEVTKELMNTRSQVEKSKSVFLFLYDNMLAMIFYTNQDSENSLRYIKLFRQNHPYATSARFLQMYYDIRFMISLDLDGTPGAETYLDSCQALARELDDTMALMRSIDFESQWLKKQGKTKEAVDRHRIYFNYLTKTKENTALKQYNNFADLFLANNQPDSAILYVKRGMEIARKNKKETKDMTSVLDILSKSYEKKGDYKQAYLYGRKQYEAYLQATEVMQKTAIADITARYDAQKKDEAIRSLQENNDLNSKFITQQRWTFIIFIILTIFIVFFVFSSYKQKLFKAEHDKLLLQHKQLVLEQKNRQNQLNPHFIYNSIANLQGLISTDKKLEANKYLVTLTKVIRDMLELNRKDFIPLEKEIDSLNNYVNLQQMRFNHSFEYHVETGDLDLDNTLIPPMLVQPFLENAIEHGLMSLEDKGCLQVRFYQTKGTLHIEITDNGVGVAENSQIKKKKESLSQVITEERIELLFGKDKHVAGMRKHPNFKHGGTGYQVEIYFPLTLNFD
ncbi:sensor histidine kinase [Sphingobacterium anhuiense]|uniref:Sensor histidine kinase n=1 Tax=Sphingobacterium anhuiense TaxID=493780 RepID=A0ABW5YYV0_9SPHI